MLPRRLTIPFLLNALRLFPGALVNLPFHRIGACCLCSRHSTKEEQRNHQIHGSTVFLSRKRSP